MSGIHTAPSTPSFMSRHRKGVIVTSLVLVPLLVAGVAYAAWLVFANGNGFARSGSAPTQPIIENIVPASLTQGAIMPGETGPLQVRVQNPNSFPLYLKAIDVIGDPYQSANTVYSAVDSNDVGSLCNVDNWRLSDKAGFSVEIAASTTSVVTVPNAVTLAANAPIGCADTVARFSVNGNDQGFTFDIAP